MTSLAAFTQLLDDTADRVTVALDALLPRGDGPEARLFQAMRYAALAGGKRLRPFFVIQCGRLFEVDERALLRVGAALECVHTYSLVHDDLPCMDDDDLRRGQPTVHKQFDEATAVLAGDALLTLAFEILADPDTAADPRARLELIRRLSTASGAKGMVGGQMIDIEAERGAALTIETLTRMQRLKTGALISYAAEAGAVIARAGPETRQALSGFAHDLGLAYQITDDLLDVVGDPVALGKAARKDARRGKASFVSTLGVEGARDQARRLAAQAKAHLEPFGSRAQVLKDATDFVIDRSN